MRKVSKSILALALAFAVPSVALAACPCGGDCPCGECPCGG